MPGPSRYAQGNIVLEVVLGLVITPPNQNANSEQVLTYTVPGAQINDFLEVNQLTHFNNLVMGNVWVSAANTVSIQWFNPTGSNVTNTVSTNFLLTITRYENANFGFAGFPTGVV